MINNTFLCSCLILFVVMAAICKVKSNGYYNKLADSGQSNGEWACIRRFAESQSPSSHGFDVCPVLACHIMSHSMSGPSGRKVRNKSSSCPNSPLTNNLLKSPSLWTETFPFHIYCLLQIKRFNLYIFSSYSGSFDWSKISRMKKTENS